MKNFILILFLFFSCSQIAFSQETLPSNESFYRESATQKNVINSELKKNDIKPLEKNNNPKIQNTKQKGLTNYQYDEANYHYYKFQKYIQDNINYSKSGKMKY